MVLVLLCPLVNWYNVLYHPVGLAGLPFWNKQHRSDEFGVLVGEDGGDDVLVEELV